jgi:hypothetical protein
MSNAKWLIVFWTVDGVRARRYVHRHAHPSVHVSRARPRAFRFLGLV